MILIGIMLNIIVKVFQLHLSKLWKNNSIRSSTRKISLISSMCQRKRKTYETQKINVLIYKYAYYKNYIINT